MSWELQKKITEKSTTSANEAKQILYNQHMKNVFDIEIILHLQ